MCFEKESKLCLSVKDKPSLLGGSGRYCFASNSYRNDEVHILFTLGRPARGVFCNRSK